MATESPRMDQILTWFPRDGFRWRSPRHCGLVSAFSQPNLTKKALSIPLFFLPQPATFRSSSSHVITELASLARARVRGEKRLPFSFSEQNGDLKLFSELVSWLCNAQKDDNGELEGCGRALGVNSRRAMAMWVIMSTNSLAPLSSVEIIGGRSCNWLVFTVVFFSLSLLPSSAVCILCSRFRRLAEDREVRDSGRPHLSSRGFSSLSDKLCSC